MPETTDIFLDTSDEQIRVVRERIERSAAKQPGFWSLFPRFREAVDALPDLGPTLGVIPEIRVVVLDACKDAGIKVPVEIWERLGVGRFAPKR